MAIYTSAPLHCADPAPWVHAFACAWHRSSTSACHDQNCGPVYAPRVSYDRQNLDGANPILASLRKYSDIDADNVRAMLEEIDQYERGQGLGTIMREADLWMDRALRFSYRHHARAVLERWQRVFA